jgi:hypothetical protein
VSAVQWSMLLGALGVLAALAGAVVLHRRRPRAPGHAFWALGLSGPLLGWLVAFLGVLDTLGGRADVLPPPAFMSSSAVGLLGVIFTEVLVRRLGEGGRPDRPVTAWLLGIAALGPGWGIALLVLAWLRG